MHEYSLSLIAPDNLAEKVEALSEDLSLNFGKFIPHTTLAWATKDTQFQYHEDTFELTVKGFYCDIDQKGRVWLGLKIVPTDALLNFRSQITAEYNTPPYEKDYFPHITLGCLTKDRLESINLVALRDLDEINKSYQFTLHFCKNGEFGKVERIIC